MLSGASHSGEYYCNLESTDVGWVVKGNPLLY